MHGTHPKLVSAFQITQCIFDEDDLPRWHSQSRKYLSHQRERRFGTNTTLQLHVIN